MPQQYVMSEPALREMFDLPDNDRDRVLRQLRRLADDPLDHGLNVKKMHGREGLYRLRIGDWRVFFTRGSLVEAQGVRRRQDTTYSATQPRLLPELPPQQQELHRARDARTLFVACTRAMRSLTVAYAAGRASPFLAGLSKDDWRRESEHDETGSYAG